MNMGFKGCHPIVNIFFYISILVFGMLFSHPVCLAASLTASLIYSIRLSGRRTVRNFVCLLLPMLFAVTLINTLFNHYGITVLAVFPWGNSLTLESIANGIVTGMVVVSVILWFFTYNEVVTTDKFMYVFGKRLPAIALIISMALRFVPMYRIKLREISDVQQGIGRDYRQGNLVTRIKHAGSIVVILVSWGLENSIETSDSMRARGYGVSKRKAYSRFIWQTCDTVVFILIILIDIVLLAGDIFGVLSCSYNPQIIINSSVDFGTTYLINELNLKINPLNFWGYLTLFSYIALAFMPIIIDLKEDLKWHKLKSKI